MSKLIIRWEDVSSGNYAHSEFEFIRSYAVYQHLINLIVQLQKEAKND